MGRPQSEETKRKISLATQRARARARSPYLPESRTCARCKKHKLAREFYIVHRTLVSGEIVAYLYPRCRECEKTRQRHHRRGMPIEERRAKEAKWKRDARRRKRENKDPMVPAKPFVDWWLSLNERRPSSKELGGSLARSISRVVDGDSDSAPLETRRVRVSVVDYVGTFMGYPYLIHALYPHG